MHKGVKSFAFHPFVHAKMLYMCRKKTSPGFTLIEILVVISIIGVLTAMVTISTGDVRANARDKARVSDLAQIQFALRLYAEQNGEYPTNEGIIGEDALGINADLAPYMGTIPKDPKDGNDFKYYYDGNARCTQNGQKVLYASELENVSLRNFADVCTASTPKDFYGGSPTNGHVIILQY